MAKPVSVSPLSPSFKSPLSPLRWSALLGLELCLLSTVVANAQITAVQCVQRPSTIAMPPPSIPLPTTQGGRTTSRANINPVCPDGQIPALSNGPAAATSSHLQKGNPLLRPQPTGAAPAVRTKKFSSFKEVYSKLARRHLAPTTQCVLFQNTCFYYAAAGISGAYDGGAMTLSVNDPSYVNPNAAGHTLDEVAVQGGAQNGNIVEVGWIVSTDLNHDPGPHIFVFHWINGNGTCYNGCGWQQFRSKYFPGQ